MTVAALYVDERGPYMKWPGVDPWGVSRDARRYEGPYPIVAHPDCGPWGSLRHLYRGNGHDCAPRAVEQVRWWGGVLEHPARSRLWAHCKLPRPNEGRDAWGGWTESVNQVDWGHACVKPTWIYCVGVDPTLAAQRPAPGTPTHGIWYGDFERSGHRGPALLGASKEIRRRTPPLFAAWLIALAQSVRPRPTFGLGFRI